MQARMTNIAILVPDAVKALQALSGAVKDGALPEKTRQLIHLRASQINGCGVCVDMHPRMMRRAGETDERIIAVGAWRDTPYFTEAERAALALTECVTRLADRSDAIPDDVWAEAARHYSEKELADLVLQISVINVWNRLNAATRQIAGQWG